MNQLEHLRALMDYSNRRSPAPWVGDRIDGTVKYRMLAADNSAVVTGDNGNNDDGPYGFNDSDDEALVMAMRNALPQLLAVADLARKVYLIETDIAATDYELSVALRDLGNAIAPLIERKGGGEDA